jgi:hypothetical protein
MVEEVFGRDPTNAGAMSIIHKVAKERQMSDQKEPIYYAVEHPLTGKATTTYVTADTMAQARNNVDRDLIKVRRATTAEVVKHIQGGGKVETAGEDSATGKLDL